MTAPRSALLLALLAAPAVHAQAPQPPPPPPRQRPVWQMDWGNYFCTLARLPTDETPFAVAFRTVPGSFYASLRLLPVRRGGLPRGTNSIVLMPSGRSYPVTERTWTMTNGGTMVEFNALPDSVWRVLEGSTELQLLHNGAVTRRIPLERSESAVRSYRACEADAMRLWGIDGAALASLSQRPWSLNSFGLTSANYPSSAMLSGTSGRMVVRVTVSPEGRASECAVVSTSNSASLDAAACPAILRGARFQIPLDAQGRPTSVRVATAITWLTPRR